MSGIPAGLYTVTLDGTTLPANFLKTAESDATLDGIIDVTTAPGPAASIAFGFAAPAAVADSRLLLDVNGNGQRDASEPGVAGVTVTRRSAGRDNQFDTADDVVQTTITDAAGGYAFAGLTPGRHRITIDLATTPPGYGFVQEVDQSTDGVVVVTLVDSQVATGLDFFFAALDLTVQKTDESVNPTTGSLVPYRITYANPSTVAAQQVRLSEVVPANTRFDAATSTPGWTCDADGAAGAHCTFEVGALAPGAGDDLHFSVVIADAMPVAVNTITNTVQIADVTSTAPDPTPLNNHAIVASAVTAAPELTIRQTDGGTRIAPGQLLTYTVTYGNQGNQDAIGVKIRQTVPPNTLFRSAGSTPGWDCADGSREGTTCTFAVGLLPARSERTLLFVLEVKPSMPVNVLTIDAEISISDASGFNASDAELTPVDSAPDLVLEKFTENETVEPGGIVRFRLRYTNLGNQDAIGVLLLETVPEYTTFTAVESGIGWNCQNSGEAGDNCIFIIGGLDAGASGEVIFAVRVDPLLPPNVDTIGSTAVVAGSGLEQDILNNEAPGTAPVTRPTAVDLVSFTLTPQDAAIYLQWKTSAERNSWGFLIHRSTDRRWEHGQDITRLVIESVGDESSGSDYAFLDETALPGVTYYYWLQELEWTGATSIYGPITGRIPGEDPGSGVPTNVFIPIVATQR
ncbi:MAG: SdrD B-like domain-containing protein [Caldilineaceae bacterium]